MSMDPLESGAVSPGPRVSAALLSMAFLDRMRTALLLLPERGEPLPLNRAARLLRDEGLLDGVLGPDRPLGKAARRSFGTGEALRYYGPLGHDRGTLPYVLVTGEHGFTEKGERALLLEIADAAPARDRERVLLHEIGTDVLTGAASRRRFFQEAERMFAEARRYGHALGVLFLDLDRFKAINDTFGHAIGDRVLQEACRVWQGTLRRSDLLARLGGEEFAVLLPYASEEGVLRTAERLRVGLRGARPAGIVDREVTASVGVALSTADDTAFEGVLDRADGALYAAKDAGRDQVHYQIG
ncbi:MAG: GGDEF domain-containing protein [Geminicoccaceae bacterium]|nr:GGDEF domain-containing protein [Geminicoccaceae bacterium]